MQIIKGRSRNYYFTGALAPQAVKTAISVRPVGLGPLAALLWQNQGKKKSC